MWNFADLFFSISRNELSLSQRECMRKKEVVESAKIEIPMGE